MDNDIGQTDLIQMHIPTKPDAAPIAAKPYLLALKHHYFLKQEIINVIYAGVIHKSMSSWASPMVIVRNHRHKCAPQQFCLCIDYRKVNSL